MTTIESIKRIYPTENPVNSINNELDRISEWFKMNKLSINVKKYKQMIYHTQNKKVNKLPLKIDEILLEPVDSFNYLGLRIDSNLKWKSHIDSVSTKLTRSIGILNRLKHIFPRKILLMLYNSIVQSHISYCISIWGHSPGRIAKLQKKAVRIITNSKYNAHTEPLFKYFNLLNVQDLYILQILKLYYKAVNSILPKYFSMYQIIRPNHQIS